MEMLQYRMHCGPELPDVITLCSALQHIRMLHLKRGGGGGADAMDARILVPNSVQDQKGIRLEVCLVVVQVGQISASVASNVLRLIDRRSPQSAFRK
jgi:hypothetical protein